jgi:UDP-N-acetylmuramate--alanine ligase
MKYHLIGDMGVSMRGIKKYLKHQGHVVTGSDLKTGGHKAENITKDIDIVVKTSAANATSAAIVEIDRARDLGIPVKRRSEMLKEITAGKNLIAISGMHGKTTVTTMAGLVLEAANYDPTILVGADVKQLDDDVIRIGNSDWFVMEACEYDRAILDFYPKILILTNIEVEHLDTYQGGLPEIKEAFVEYINHLPDDGVIIACHDDKKILDVLSKVSTKAKVIFYGFTADKYNKLDIALPVPGQHNILNALSVLALTDYLGINRDIFVSVMQDFKGAHRRFELLGQYNNADLIDDYGHHPTEIATTIGALAERYPNEKKIVVFWPHQYKRIKPLLKEFAEALSLADEAIVKPIFFVPGRDEIQAVSSEELVQEINKIKPVGRYFETDKEIVEYLKSELNDKTVLLTIGIPPVYEITKKLLEK